MYFYQCSHFTDPVILEVVPASEQILSLVEPASSGTYEEITWYKGSREGTIAMYHPDLTDGDVLYFGEFCSGEEPCETSGKGLYSKVKL